MAGLSQSKAIALAVLLAASWGALSAQPREIKLFAKPTELAFQVGSLDREKPAVVLGLFNSWALVRQGETVGWAPLDEIQEGSQIRWSADLGNSAPLSHPAELPQDLLGHSWSVHFNGLLDFAAGDSDHLRRTEELREGARAKAVSSEWGPLFYRRTPYYYWKGIQLWRLFDKRLSLNLVKGKYNQQAMFGGLWSDSLIDSVVESNRGVLGNRSIFGRGRNYFFELRYTF